MRHEGGHREQQRHALAVVLQLAIGNVVEHDDRDAQSIPQGQASGQGGEMLSHALQHVVELPPRQVVLGGEVTKERAAADAARRRNVVDRDLVEAALDKEPQTRVADLGVRRGRLTTDAHDASALVLGEFLRLSCEDPSLRH